jgi:hypothetical protein
MWQLVKKIAQGFSSHYACVQQKAATVTRFADPANLRALRPQAHHPGK